MTIGERIKDLRERNNMSKTDIAIKLGIAPQSVFKYEKNIVTNIPMENIEKLAEIFDVSPCYIMGWEDSNEASSSYLQKGKPSPIQQKILSNCKQLNETGQKKVLDFSDDLVSTGKYSAPLVPESSYNLVAYGGDNESVSEPEEENIT